MADERFPMVQTMTILYSRISRGGINRVTAAVDGQVVRGLWTRSSDLPEARAAIIDVFLDLWKKRTSDVVALHVSDRLVAGLLKEQSDAYEGLLIRDVVTGENLRETFAVCSREHNHRLLQRQERLKAPPQHRPKTLVVATDASVGRYSELAGLAAVSTTGEIRAVTATVRDTIDAELAAIEMAVKKFSRQIRRGHFIVVTDSQQAAKYLSGETPTLHARARQIKRTIAAKIPPGVEFRCVWMHGHSGHALNELANRAAILTRRCAQMRLDNRKQMIKNLNIELSQELKGVPPKTWVSSACELSTCDCRERL